MRKLLQAHAVVALLTPRSINRAWLLFEVGVGLGRGIPTYGVATAVPLLEIGGPFSQLQNVADDDEALTSALLQLLNALVSNANPRRRAVLDLAKRYRRQAARVIARDPGDAAPSETERILRTLTDVRESIAALHSRVGGFAAQTAPTDWFSKAKQLLLDLAVASGDQRAQKWDKLLAIMADRLENLPPGMKDVWIGFEQGNDERVRLGVATICGYAEAVINDGTVDLEVAAVIQRMAGIIQQWDI
jgi:hypothetical protein